ncbi:hypothetical protein GCM10018966_064270 [Streptomyces yanii]
MFGSWCSGTGPSMKVRVMPIWCSFAQAVAALTSSSASTILRVGRRKDEVWTGDRIDS